jgi:hypothetical protein
MAFIAPVSPWAVADFPSHPDSAIAPNDEHVELVIVLTGGCKMRPNWCKARRADRHWQATSLAIRPRPVVDFPGGPDRAIVPNDKDGELFVVLPCSGKRCAGRSEPDGRDAHWHPSVVPVAPGTIIEAPGNPDRSIEADKENIELIIILSRNGEMRSGTRETGRRDATGQSARNAVSPRTAV